MNFLTLRKTTFAVAFVGLATIRATCAPKGLAGSTHLLDLTTDLVGSWTGACVRLHPQPIDGFDNTTTARALVRFTTSEVNVNLKTFHHLNCERHDYTTDIVSGYRLGQASIDDQSITPIDYELKSIQITYHNAADLNDLNDISFCGYTDWQVNVPKNVAGRQCFDDEPALPAAGSSLYDIISLREGRLFSGLSRLRNSSVPAALDGSTPAKRPTSLNLQENLTRVSGP